MTPVSMHLPHISGFFRWLAQGITLLAACQAIRAEQVVISEIMYNPPPGKPEFIEIWNITYTPLDMEKWRFTDGVDYTFPPYSEADGDAFLLKPQERIVVSSADPATTRAAYPSLPAQVRVFGPWQGALNNAGERITLSDKNGALLCTVNYKPNRRWPVAADGTGHSLVLINENKKIDDDRNWRASGLNGGSPGLPETTAGLAAGILVLNEVHYDDQGKVDFVEIKNISTQPHSAEGLFVSSRTDFADKIPLSGVVAAEGYASFDTAFPADEAEAIYLLDANSNVIDAVELRRRAGLPSFQAWPEGSKEWYSTMTPTRNSVNAPQIDNRVVINEIMYDPPSKHRDGEFIEFYNRSSEPVSLAGWRVRGEVDFTFPAGSQIPPHSYLVISANAEWFQQTYGITALGDWSGRLANGGGRLRLEDANDNLVDEVYYMPGGDWPELAAGRGSSLELIHPDMDNSLPSAWRASDESNKTTFQTFSFSGQWRNWRTVGGPSDTRELNGWLTGAGEVIIRNIRVQKNGSGENLLQNPHRLSPDNPSGNPASNGGWLARGTHWQSYFDESGDFHIISEGHGENKRNLVECDLSPLSPNDYLTITFEARWVWGRNRLIWQTFDQSVGKDFAIPVPNNLGTPGAPNSRAQASPLPQVDGLIHSPAVPKPGQPVVVSARVTSVRPLISVSLKHRLDNINNNAAWQTVAMNDSGVNGDAKAGDGIWSAIISYPSNGNIAQFYVEAVAEGGGTAVQPKHGPNEPAMFVVDSKTVPQDGLRVQRLIISAYWRDALRSNTAGTVGGASAKFHHKFPKLQSHYFPAVFIHNESEIYYGVGMRKSGSPWTRPDDNNYDSGLSRGAWKTPEDRIFRGQSKRGWDNEAVASNGLHNRLVRYWLYLMGQPYNTGEFVRHIINNSNIFYREDVEPDNNDLLDRAFPDGSDGELFAVEDGWWIPDFDDQNRTYQDADWDYNQTTKNSDEPTRWHNEYACRTREGHYDYAALTSLIQMIDLNQFTQRQLERLLDIDSVAAYQAVRGYAGDWDSFLMNRGKNSFLYRPPNGGTFRFLHWDSDLAFQNASEVFIGSGRNIPNVFNKGYVRRKFIHYLNVLLEKYSNSSNNNATLSKRIEAWMDAEKAAFPQSTWAKTFYTNWFRSRFAPARSHINASAGGGSNAYSAPFALLSPPATTADAVISLRGTAPALAAVVVLEGQPEATLTWEDAKTFALSGVILREGSNTLTLRMLSDDGLPLGEPIVHHITKTGNTAPTVRLTCSSPTYRARIGEIITVDASASSDPEGGALAYEWTILPASGVSVGQPDAATRSLQFLTPGVYTVTVTATDTAGQKTTAEREIVAYNTSDSTSFDTEYLASFLTAQNVKNRDNYAPLSWYSLQDVQGRLQIQVTNLQAQSLNSGTHPYIYRALPTSTDWTLQTSSVFDSRVSGAFQSGLYVEMMEDGVPVRYAFGVDGGSILNVRRSVDGGAFIGPVKTLRINCGGGDVQELTQNALWQADAYYMGGTTVWQNFTSSTNGLVNDNVRVDPVGFSYAIPVANGTYNIRLYAATGGGLVEQQVTLNGVSQAWSIATGLGSQKMLSFNDVVVANNLIQIQVTRTGGDNPNAVLTGIEIVPVNPSPALDTDFTALRVRRVGNQLLFAREAEPGVWVDVQTFTLPPGSTAVRGGLFVATEVAQSVRMSFDYLLLADPQSSNSVLSNLRITELMYHPATGNVEFIELKNVGSEPINLEGVYFEDGRPVDTYVFPALILSPGEHIILTNNVAEFQALYGTGSRVAGAWSGGALNNAGERVVLRDAQGNVIHDFTYSDQPPWPTEADGQGPSLEVIDVYGDYNDPANWRASAIIGGTPGTSDGPAPVVDSDHDGVPDDIEELFGTDPQSAGSWPQATVEWTPNGQVYLSWPTAVGRRYFVERSTDLQEWTRIHTVEAATAAFAEFTDSPPTGNPQLFYRVEAERN